MKLLTKEQHESYKNAKIYHICKEKFENRYFKDKKYRKIRDHCHYTGQYRGAAHSLFNLDYSVPNKIPIVSNNGPNYEYYFVIKELAEEFKNQFTCLGEKNEKYITLTQFQWKKKLEKLIKMEKKLQKIYLTYYNSLIVQDLWQAHNQILSIIFLKEFLELNVYTDMMIENLKHVEPNVSIATVSMNI